MKKILKLYKKMSETPLECLERWRVENQEYKNEKMTYAGRLDPMAEGELLVLVGDECKNKEQYLNLDKEYECEILFGFQTDTFDILGLANHLAPQALSDYGGYDIARHQGRVERFLAGIKCKQTQKYPPFSSKTVDGKPLFQITKDKIKLNTETRVQTGAGQNGTTEGNAFLKTAELPEREIEIYETELLKNYWLKGRDLKADIFKRILLVRGDFRQEETLSKWNEILTGRAEERFLVSRIRIKCSSGTYVRGIADNLGKKIGLPALALKIIRTKILYSAWSAK